MGEEKLNPDMTNTINFDAYGELEDLLKEGHQHLQTVAKVSGMPTPDIYIYKLKIPKE